ncbi:pentapeptide repeat-containing protein [Actinokineospora guangxiensis]|uniref:Pentapeptide repeat-containing protein n=1 Tax=Actinokineospora guangxiensis TaxID=1490288 RepID=A0ABW0EMG1_9PSEU
MTQRMVLGIVASVLVLLCAVIVSVAVVPQSIYPMLSEADLRGVSSAETRIQLQQAQAQLQNSVRSTLLQLTAGLLVIAGAAATWRQVHVNREGQITDRFTRAIEQLGNDNVDVRIGAVYALERIARNSPADRTAVQFTLAAFVRNHAPWHVGSSGGPVHPTVVVEERPWLQILAPDIQAAVGVLARRLPAPRARREFPVDPKLYLSRVDLRGVQLYRGRRLVNTQLRYANLARSWLEGTRLDGCDLKSADLRRCRLVDASLLQANLNGAFLSGADLSGADLRESDLRGADLAEAILDGAKLDGVKVDAGTVWPAGFDISQYRRVRFCADSPVESEVAGPDATTSGQG